LFITSVSTKAAIADGLRITPQTREEQNSSRQKDFIFLAAIAARCTKQTL